MAVLVYTYLIGVNRRKTVRTAPNRLRRTRSTESEHNTSLTMQAFGCAALDSPTVLQQNNEQHATKEILMWRLNTANNSLAAANSHMHA
jgi:hypothetical protein